MLDDHILRHLPCVDVYLFRKLRPFPYDVWSARLTELFQNGTIGWKENLIIRLKLDGAPPTPVFRPRGRPPKC